MRIRAAYGWSGRQPIPGPVVLRIGDGRIRSLGRDAEPAEGDISDFGEATILPGLVDMHTHLGINHRTGDIRAQMTDRPVRHILAGAASLREDLLSGVTTAKLNGDREFYDVQMRDAIRAGTAEGPRLCVSGRGIKSSRCTGGVVATCIADDAASVCRFVDENLCAGVDWIKLFSSGNVFGDRETVLQPFYGLQELRTTTERAHAAGKRVCVHCFGGESADACREAGVDVLDHGWLLSDRQLDALAKSGTWLCPTISVLTHPEGVLAHLSGAALDAARRRIDEVCEVARCAIRSGVRLLAGTDAMHGGLVDELMALQALGATPEQLLRAATGSAGEALGLEDEVGVLRESGPADLIVVQGHALGDVKCLQDVLLVMQGGRVVYDVRGPTSGTDWGGRSLAGALMRG